MSKAAALHIHAIAVRIPVDASLEVVRMGIVWSCAAALALAGTHWAF